METILEKQKKTSKEGLNHLPIGTTWSHCHRCNGLLVPEYGIDLHGALVGGVRTCRCVQCGDVIDPIILKNRDLQRGNGGPPDKQQRRVLADHDCNRTDEAIHSF